MKDNNSIQLTCQCGEEVLVIDPQDRDHLEEGLYFSIWMLAYADFSFWHRFKHAWHILRYGTPYTDQICFNINSVKALSRFLQSYLDKVECNGSKNK